MAPLSRRLSGALILVGVSVINLVANLSWLQTGDVHRANFHAVMRGGLPGLWMTTVLFGALLLVGLGLLVLEWRERRRRRAL
jgi:hypothetical protein